MSVDPTTPEQMKSVSALVVFGTDGRGKPHASAFKPDDAELATKAAGLMGMHLLHLATPEHVALAAKLPQGRVFASGKGFVPFVGRPLYEQLCALGGHDPEEAAPKPSKVERLGTARRTTVAPTGVAQQWDQIGSGSLVLATDGAWQGWWECVVLSIEPDDTIVLRWRDFAEPESFTRRRDELGMLPSATPLASIVEQEAQADLAIRSAKNKS